MRHILTILLVVTSPIWASFAFVALMLFVAVVNLPKFYRAIYEVIGEFYEAVKR